jgi:hypothetical protein
MPYLVHINGQLLYHGDRKDSAVRKLKIIPELGLHLAIYGPSHCSENGLALFHYPEAYVVSPVSVASGGRKDGFSEFYLIINNEPVTPLSFSAQQSLDIIVELLSKRKR